MKERNIQMSNKCPICKSEAKINEMPKGKDMNEVNCPKCGEFTISGTLTTCIKRYGNHIISGILRNRYENGEEIDLHTGNIEQLIQSTHIPDDPFDKIDLLIKHIINTTDSIVKPMNIDINNDFPLLFLENKREYQYYLQKAKELGYIELPSTESIQLTLKGWKRLEEIRKKSIKSDQAFVAMWFADKMNPIYDDGFKPALEDTGYNPVRMDLKEHNDKICDKIIAEIRKSGLLIADFTGNQGGVYFDTRQYNHIVWEDAEDLKEKLVNRIEATIPKN